MIKLYIKMNIYIENDSKIGVGGRFYGVLILLNCTINKDLVIKYINFEERIGYLDFILIR